MGGFKEEKKKMLLFSWGDYRSSESLALALPRSNLGLHPLGSDSGEKKADSAEGESASADQPSSPCTQSWGSLDIWQDLHATDICCSTALQKQLCRILGIYLDLRSTQSNHLQIKFTFFLQALSASWSWLKRSASDVWILSCGFVFFTLSFSLVNSASLRRQTHVETLFFLIIFDDFCWRLQSVSN